MMSINPSILDHQYIAITHINNYPVGLVLLAFTFKPRNGQGTNSRLSISIDDKMVSLEKLLCLTSISLENLINHHLYP